MRLADHLAALHAASFARPWDAAAFDTLLANPTTHAVTTDHGFALLQILAPEAEVITLSILHPARSQGHGQALLSKALDHAAQTGVDTVFLEVEATNKAARALYAKAGFTETARRAAYYPQDDGTPPVDAIQMRLRLGA